MTRLIIVALFSLPFMIDISAKTDKAEYGPVDRMIVVGDIHGDFERFKAVLKTANLIDSKLRWTGGKTHLVQLGDIPDRGPDTLEIINFLKRLEKGAARAGGHVHILIGNHEAMNMYGDLRYVFKKEFEAFASRRSKALLDNLFKAEVDWMKKNMPKEEWPEFDEIFKENWLKDRPLGYVEHRQNWLPDGEIGKWVLTKNAVLKIGDTLFVHAGISPSLVDWSINDINSAVRDSLKNIDDTDDSLLSREDGPLWYRGLALNNEELEEDQVQRALEHFKVKRIVVGHTPTPGVIVPRFNGRVILADVGLSGYYGDHLACLEIEKGKIYAIHRGERLELPDANSESIITYLDAINRLEPNNKDAQNWISRLKKTLLAKESAPPGKAGE